MTPNNITKHCIDKLNSYASKEVYLWNPFKFFKKRKLKNYEVGYELATLLNKPVLTQDDILKIVTHIDNFEDATLQQDLIYLLNHMFCKDESLQLSKRHINEEIKHHLRLLVDKKYKPWWTFYLIEIDYFSYSFRLKINDLITIINNSFESRRHKKRHYLINLCSNDKQVDLTLYQPKTEKITATDIKLHDVLNAYFVKINDYATKKLIEEIQKLLLQKIPFGNVLVSVAAFSSIFNSYLSNPANKNKPATIQAQEVMFIVCRTLLQMSITQVIKSFVPIAGDFITATIMVLSSESSINPLESEKKISGALASVAGGIIGGALGSGLPIVGTTLGTSAGVMLSRAAVNNCYQTIEKWQTAPRNPEISIIPSYLYSYLAFVDNDGKQILSPLKSTYIETESNLKKLGNKIARWLCIFILLLEDDTNNLDEYLEIIDEEISELKAKFNQLKNNHGQKIKALYQINPDNPKRVNVYKNKVKSCLSPLQEPINNMLDKYSLEKIANQLSAANKNSTMCDNHPIQLSEGLLITDTSESSSTITRDSFIVVQGQKKADLLMLDGDKGTVATRIHDSKTSATFPRYSSKNVVECASRSLLRLKNLKAVRGGSRGASMIGPADYYGNLETPHLYTYSIAIDDGLPIISRHSREEWIPRNLKPFDNTHVTSIKAQWLSGHDKQNTIKQLASEFKKHANQSLFGDSLFPNPGLLLIDSEEPIKLYRFDPRNIDLSSFKARIVKNDRPFQIIDTPLNTSDEFRVVSYHYQPNYAADRIQNGGGLFLETHDFFQTMTPLDSEASGYVTLGRYNDEPSHLELIAVVIPYGYTLLVDKDCIHGDSTLVGSYMMNMTSNHLTMKRANTVFLKTNNSKKNISIILDDPQSETTIIQTKQAPLPINIFKDATKDETTKFWTEIRQQGRVITQPGSPFAWQYTFWQKHKGRSIFSSNKKDVSDLLEETKNFQLEVA
jgi:hypothetical protein